ncbi:MAG TPA: hypothetical protein VN829_06830, partial [Dongiaceae bacterium]|nr:hypothetical protein [Dongiaceae bacterium]
MKSKRTKATELRLPVSEEKTESANAGGAPRPGGAKGGGNGSTPVAQPVTEVVARVDVGFGNTLFIRGQGNGLSWERGTRLACAGPSTW